MKLYLVQHGEACSKEIDPDRPLTDKGKVDIDRMAEFLSQANIRLERVIHSGKLRARQTAERMANVMAPGLQPEVSGLINPNDEPAVFVRQSRGWDGETLVVGHLPFMARLVSFLVIEDENKLLAAYKPGSVVCLEPIDDAHWQIDWMIRPELLN